VSASAAANTYIGGAQGDGISSYSTSNTTLAGVAGPANFVKIGFAGTYIGVATISGGTFGSSADTHVVLNTAGTSASADGSQAAGALVTIPTPTVGTITVNYYKQITVGVYASTVTESVVITVSATASAGAFSVAKSSVWLASGETSTPATADATVNVSSLAAAAGDSGTAAATIQVLYLDGLGKGISLATDSITATITSGPGTINGASDTNTIRGSQGLASALTNVVAQYSKSIVPSAYGEVDFVVWPNGQSGTSVVTIKNAAGTILGTKSIVFAGTTAGAMTVTVKKAYVLNSAIPTKNVLAVHLYDGPGGNEITGASAASSISGVVATGSTIGAAITAGDCVWNTTDLVSYCSVKSAGNLVAGKETYSLTTSKGTATGSAVVNFVSGVAKTITISGPASADPGTKVNYTLTANDAAGSPLPDGVYTSGTLLTAVDPVSNAQLVAQPFGKGETITLAGGVATDYTYAPFSGTLSLSWTAAGSASATADSAASVANDGTLNDSVVTPGFAKGSGAATITADDVAVSANTDATAAANAATDAANAAADAADQATAAVTELQTQVVALIAAIQKQITALTVLINKIKVKVKA
jgi:hypothetical protein